MKKSEWLPLSSMASYHVWGGTSTWTGQSAGFAFRLNFQVMVALTLLVAMCHDAEGNAKGNAVIVHEEI